MHPQHTEVITVWGMGLIGYTLAGELARTGHRCLGVDIDPSRVALLNSGALPFTHLPDVATVYTEEVRSGALRATTEAAQALAPGHAVHILCIPTEAAGQIDSEILRQVAAQIAAGAQARPLYLVIESTIAPDWIDRIVHAAFAAAGLEHGADYHLGASPRRDWLTEQGRTLASTPKVIGGDSPDAVALMRKLYEPICGTIIEAPDAKHAAMVKVVENYFRYRDLLIAGELALAMPDYDIAAVLRLAGTKWNMNQYHPSLGIGGYCVPLAKDYLAEQGRHTGLAARLAADEERIFAAARAAVCSHGEVQTVAVLGIAYAPEMKIHTRSPGARLARELASSGAEVLVHDPLYTAEELTAITGCPALAYPDGLSACDTIVLATAHRHYRRLPQHELESVLRPGATIIDNLGTWADRSFGDRFHYREVGGRGYFDTDRRPQ